jgi:hypothetical protein
MENGKNGKKGSFASRQFLVGIVSSFKDGARFRPCLTEDFVPGKVFYRVPWGGFDGAFSLEGECFITKEGKRCEVVAPPPGSRSGYIYYVFSEDPGEIWDELPERLQAPLMTKNSRRNFTFSVVAIET